MLGYNALLALVTIAALGLFTAKTPYFVIFVVLLVGGGFRVMQFSGLKSICCAEGPERDISQATSLFATLQQLSMGVGVTVGAFFLQASNWLQRDPRIVADDFWQVFLALGLFPAAPAYSAFTLSPDAGAEMAGRTALARGFVTRSPYRERAGRLRWTADSLGKVRQLASFSVRAPRLRGNRK